MTPNDKLTQINKQIREHRATAKQAPANSKPDVAALKARIRALTEQLAALKESVGRISGTRLVRMVKSFQALTRHIGGTSPAAAVGPRLRIYGGFHDP